MISQCLESGVIFQIPKSWPMSTRTSCARYRYKHDPSTIHKEQVHTYTSRLKVLHIDSRVAHELEVIMGQQGTRVPCEGYDVSRQEARRGYTSAQALHPNRLWESVHQTRWAPSSIDQLKPKPCPTTTYNPQRSWSSPPLLFLVSRIGLDVSPIEKCTSTMFQHTDRDRGDEL